MTMKILPLHQIGYCCSFAFFEQWNAAQVIENRLFFTLKANESQ